MACLYKKPDYWHSLALYALVFVALPELFRATQHSRLDNYLGEYSYPVYLFHYVFVVTLIHSNCLAGGIGALVVLTLTLLHAAAAVHWLQKRVDQFRHRRYLAD